MREIKFRLIKDGKIVGYVRPQEKGHDWVWSKDGIVWHLDIIIKHDKKNQYTGLKDKNGTEIFEGDVVSYMHDPSEVEGAFKCFAKVEFSDGAYWPRPLKEDCGDPYYDNHYYDLEVIGNISENPELLA